MFSKLSKFLSGLTDTVQRAASSSLSGVKSLLGIRAKSGSKSTQKQTKKSVKSATELVPVIVLDKIERACEKAVDRMTPNSGTGKKWKIKAEQTSARSVSLTIDTTATGGEKIYANLLLGARTKEWKIPKEVTSKSKPLIFKVNRAKYSAYNIFNFKIAQVTRRRAHYDGTRPTKSTNGPWIHPNFMDIKLDLEREAKKILIASYLGHFDVDASGVTYESIS